MNWDDLKLFASAARQGSFSRAAAELGTTHSTVSRRVGALEKALDIRLFDRLTTGLVLTSGGEELYATADGMAQMADEIERKVTGRDTQLQGVIRVSAIDLMISELMPGFHRFLELYPGIELQVSATASLLNLTRREADVAIRITNNPPENLVGRKVAKFDFAVYGSKKLIDRMGPDAGLKDYPWVVPDELTYPILIREWMEKNIGEQKIVARMGSPSVMTRAVAEGLGIGHLGLVSAESDPQLVRLSPVEKISGIDIWLLSHPDVRRSTRIRAFFDFMADEIKGKFDLDVK